MNIITFITMENWLLTFRVAFIISIFVIIAIIIHHIFFSKNKQERADNQKKYQAWLEFLENYKQKFPVVTESESIVQLREAEYFFAKRWHSMEEKKMKVENWKYRDLIIQGNINEEIKLLNEWKKAEKKYLNLQSPTPAEKEIQREPKPIKT